jgi:alkylation response protein AidB-like acyl-CoA dehydrogenase
MSVRLRFSRYPYPVERMMRELTEIFESTNHIQRAVIARELLR